MVGFSKVYLIFDPDNQYNYNQFYRFRPLIALYYIELLNVYYG